MSEPDPRDQRLAQFAQDVMKTQLQQNDRITAQSQADPACDRGGS